MTKIIYTKRSRFSAEGQGILVDCDDYDRLIKSHWHIAKTGGYAIRSSKIKDYHHKLMHREIMNCPKDMQVDHINGDRLDNRKENLRIVTNSQNQMNRKASKYKYKGVYPSRNGNWIVSIMVNKKKKSLGTYKCVHEAGKAYNKAASEFFGEYAG